MADATGHVRFEVDPQLDRVLEAGLVSLWADVANAGGAVGFVPPVTPEVVGREVDHVFERIRRGPDRLVVALDGEVPVGMATLEFRDGQMFAHWAWLKRVQVHPAHQGRGLGSGLVRALHDLAREIGLERLFLTVRAGEGLEAVYERLGYRHVATLPRVIRVGPDDVRDEHHFTFEL